MELARSFHTAAPMVAGSIYGNLGAAFQATGDPQRAIPLLESARDIARACKDWNALTKAYGNLGRAYQATGNFSQALGIYQEDGTLARQQNDWVQEVCL